MSPGERRRRRAKREREEAAFRVKISVLRAQGSSCANCEHRERAPFDASEKWICGLTSGFDGYTPVKLDHLCTDWNGKPG